MNLQELQTLFPNTGGNHSLTGRIPMSWVEANKEVIKTIVKENKLRRFYRGPRGRSWDQTSTWKQDAKDMVLYFK